MTKLRKEIAEWLFPVAVADFVQPEFKSKHSAIESTNIPHRCSHVSLTWGKENQLIRSSEVDGSIGAIKSWNAVGFFSIVAGNPAWMRYNFSWKSNSAIEQQILIDFFLSTWCGIFLQTFPLSRKRNTHSGNSSHPPLTETSTTVQKLSLKRRKIPKRQPSRSTLWSDNTARPYTCLQVF